MKWARLAIIVVVLAALSAAGVFVFRRSTASVRAENAGAVPTTRVARGSLELTVHLTGELRAAKQQVVVAPTVGGNLRILDLIDSGETVKTDDVILEFDPADQLYALEQAKSEVAEAEQEIIQRKASNAAQVAQDKVALLTEDFNVKRAELDAAVDKELIPGRDFNIRQAQLIEARRTKTQVESDVKTRANMASAGLTVLQQKLARANLNAERAQQNIDNLVIKAPMDGVVSVRQNQDASGGIFFSGMVLPQFRVGDTTNPGRPILDIFDVSQMQIRATVNEQERDNVQPGLAVKVEANVAPGPPLDAKVVSVSSLGQPDRYSGPLRMFEVLLSLDKADERLRPGTSVDIVVHGKKVDGTLLLPRQAVFEREGKPIVFERTSTGWEPREIKVLHRTESQIALEGVPEGVEVALVNPRALPTTGAPKPAASGPGLTK